MGHYGPSLMSHVLFSATLRRLLNLTQKETPRLLNHPHHLLEHLDWSDCNSNSVPTGELQRLAAELKPWKKSKPISPMFFQGKFLEVRELSTQVVVPFREAQERGSPKPTATPASECSEGRMGRGWTSSSK